MLVRNFGQLRGTTPELSISDNSDPQRTAAPYINFAEKTAFFYPHPQFTRSCPFFYYIFGQLRDSNIFFTRSCPSELSVFFIIFSDNSGTLTFLPGVVPRSCPKFAGIMLQKTCNFFSSPGVVHLCNRFSDNSGTVPSSTVRSFLPTAGSISARPRGFHGQLRSCPSGIIPLSLLYFLKTLF